MAKYKWKSVSSYGDTYNFTEVGQSLTGVYQGFLKTEIDGEERLKHQIVPEGKDKPVELWESKVLETLRRVPKGCPVQITFQGLGKRRKGMNAPKLFDVQIPENVNLLDGTGDTALVKTRSRKRR